MSTTSLVHYYIWPKPEDHVSVVNYNIYYIIPNNLNIKLINFCLEELYTSVIANPAMIQSSASTGSGRNT